MKKCPTCNRSYDESQSFCLMDGIALVVENEIETKVSQSPAPRKSKFPMVVLGLLIFVILAGGAAVAGWFLFNKYRQSESVGNKNQPVNTKASPTNTSTPTPKPASNSPVEESSPKPESSKQTSENEDTGEITPIDWGTTPGGFNGEVGQIFKFKCPEEGTEHTIYGSDIYTLDSSICTAAVHAGLISLAEGGVVTVEIRPGRQIYGSTTRNGIKSSTWGPYPQSFVVR
jgi:hypothetical protein